MKKKTFRKFFVFLRSLLIAAVMIVAVLLGILDYGIPHFIHSQIERELSSGCVRVRFDHASFGLFRGIDIRNITVGENPPTNNSLPLVEIRRLCAKVQVGLCKPHCVRIDNIQADDVYVRPFLELPDTSDDTNIAALIKWCSDNNCLTSPVHISLRNVDAFTVKAKQLVTDFHITDSIALFDSIGIDVQSLGFDEHLSGVVTIAPTPCDIRASLQGTLTPEVIEKLISFLDGDEANEFIGCTDNFSAPLQVCGEIYWKSFYDESVAPTEDFRVSVQGSGLTYNSVPVRNFNLNLQWCSSMTDGKVKEWLSIAPLNCEFGRGSGTISLAWHPETSATDISATATAHPNDLAMVIWNSIPEVLTNFSFQTLPTVTANGCIMPEKLIEQSFITGTFTNNQSAIHDVPVNDVSFDYSFHNAVLLDFTKLSGTITNSIGNSSVSGKMSIVIDEDDPIMDLDLETTALPDDIAKVAINTLPEVLTNFTFSSLPYITVHGRVFPERLPPEMSVYGDFTMPEAAMHGVPLEDVSLKYWFHDETRLDVTNFYASIPNSVSNSVVSKSSVSGDMFVEISDDDPILDIDIKTTALPTDIAMVAIYKIPEVVTNFTFETLPSITARGLVMPQRVPVGARLVGTCEVESAFARTIPLKNVKFDFTANDELLTFTNITASVFDGPLTGCVSVIANDLNPDLDLDIRITDADFAKARRNFTTRRVDDGGKLNCEICLHGIAATNKLDTLRGEFNLDVNGGHLMRIPLFAGLTDFVGRNVPGVDLLLMQSDAKVECTLTNGLVNVKEMSVFGNLFSMVMSGNCRINKEHIPVDMTAQIRFLHSQTLIGKLANIVTLPVRKMMEFRITGPLYEPTWSYIGIFDRIKSIFWTRKDETALTEDESISRTDTEKLSKDNTAGEKDPPEKKEKSE